MADRSWDFFFKLEVDALRYTRPPNTFRADGELEGHVPDGIRNDFDDLDSDERNTLADAIEKWIRLKTIKEDAQKAVDKVANYAGSTDDGDVYGKEDTSRSSLDQYLDAQKQCLEATRLARESVVELLKVHGQEEGDVTLYLNHILETDAQSIQNIEDVLGKTVDLEESVRQKLERRRRIALGMPGEQWQYMKKLGEGGFGRAGVYVKIDDLGLIVDRLVMKDSHFSKSPDDWNDTSLWSGSQKNVPNEVQSLYNLRGKDGSSNIIRIRGWRIRKDKMMHRIFMEYCPLGDLRDLIVSDRSVYGSQKARWENIETDLSASVEMLPEPFAWHLLETLCVAGLLMERGEIEKDGMLPWETIVHRDLKLPNVFLGTSSQDRYIGYPQPKLGDFGIAVFIPEDDERDPASIREIGSKFKMAPEQHHLLRNEDGSVMPLSSKTNVWGVGAVMWMLLMCEDIIIPLSLDEAEEISKNREQWLVRENFEPKPFDASAQGKYSKELRDVIMQCLEYEPSKRPSFDAIHKIIRTHTGGSGDNLAQGLRKEQDVQGFKQAGTRLHLKYEGVSKKDHWAVGQTMEASRTYPEGKSDFPSPVREDKVNPKNSEEFIDTFRGEDIQPSGEVPSPTDPPEKSPQAAQEEEEDPRAGHGDKKGKKRQTGVEGSQVEPPPKRPKRGKKNDVEAPAADRETEDEPASRPAKGIRATGAKGKGKERAPVPVDHEPPEGEETQNGPIRTRSKRQLAKAKDKGEGNAAPPEQPAADSEGDGDGQEDQQPKRRSGRTKSNAKKAVDGDDAAPTGPGRVSKKSRAKKTITKAAPKKATASANGKAAAASKDKGKATAKATRAPAAAATGTNATCAGINKNGARCKRTVKDGTHCHQHRHT